MALKKLFLLAVVVGAGYFGYRTISHAAARKVYKNFADAWVRGDDVQALKFADGEKMKAIPAEKSREFFLHSSFIDAYHGVSYVVDSSRRDGGALVLEARQLLSYDPPGVTSALTGGMIASFRHVVTLRKTADGWKVVSFEPSLTGIRPWHGSPPAP